MWQMGLQALPPSRLIVDLTCEAEVKNRLQNTTRLSGPIGLRSPNSLRWQKIKKKRRNLAKFAVEAGMVWTSIEDRYLNDDGMWHSCRKSHSESISPKDLAWCKMADQCYEEQMANDRASRTDLLPLHLCINKFKFIEDIKLIEGYWRVHCQGANFRDTTASKELNARNLMGKLTIRQKAWAEQYDEIRRKIGAIEIEDSPWPNRNLQYEQTVWTDKSAQGSAAN